MNALARNSVVLAAAGALCAWGAKPAWELRGSVSDGGGRPVTGTLLIHMSLHDSTVGGREVWKASRYVTATAGRFRLALTNPSPPESAVAGGYRLQVRTAAGSRWRIGDLDLRSPIHGFEARRSQLRANTDRLALRLEGEENLSDLRDSLSGGNAPDDPEEMKRLKSVLRGENRLIQRRLAELRRRGGR